MIGQRRQPGLKERLRSFAARALRGVIDESALDLDLQLQLNARASSAEYVEAHFAEAKAFPNKFGLLKYAIGQADPEGLLCEFGVYRATTANFIADQIGNRVLHGFDSFVGLPEPWRGNIGTGFFSLNAQLPSVRSNVVLYPGWFQDTLPEFVRSHPEPAAFLHIDCDIYSSTVCVLNAFADRIRKGTVVVFDEYFNYPTWRQHEYKALQEFVSASGRSYRYIAYNSKGQQVAVQFD